MPALSFHYVLLELGVERKYNNIGATVEFYELLTMVIATEGIETLRGFGCLRAGSIHDK